MMFLSESFKTRSTHSPIETTKQNTMPPCSSSTPSARITIFVPSGNASETELQKVLHYGQVDREPHWILRTSKRVDTEPRLHCRQDGHRAKRAKHNTVSGPVVVAPLHACIQARLYERMNDASKGDGNSHVCRIFDCNLTRRTMHVFVTMLLLFFGGWGSLLLLRLS